VQLVTVCTHGILCTAEHCLPPAVSKRGMASGHAAGMADVFAWLQKDSMSKDTKPQFF